RPRLAQCWRCGRSASHRKIYPKAYFRSRRSALPRNRHHRTQNWFCCRKPPNRRIRQADSAVASGTDRIENLEHQAAEEILPKFVPVGIQSDHPEIRHSVIGAGLVARQSRGGSRSKDAPTVDRDRHTIGPISRSTAERSVPDFFAVRIELDDPAIDISKVTVGLVARDAGHGRASDKVTAIAGLSRLGHSV